VLAELYVARDEPLGLWAVLVVIVPLLFARQMFLRSHALEEAHVELQEREEILRELSNTMAEERADERLQIAGYLHDDLAQVLFRLSLQVDIARKLLEKEDLDELRSQLEKIRESKQETSDRIRALIRDDKVHQIESAMQAGKKYGMQTMNDALYQLYVNREVAKEECMRVTSNPNEFLRMIGEAPTDERGEGGSAAAPAGAKVAARR